MPRFPTSRAAAATLPARPYSRLVARAEARGRAIVPLHIGDTHLPPHPSGRAAAQTELAHPGLHRYAPVAGLPELREAASRYLERRFARTFTPDDVQVTAGGTAGLFAASQALLAAGDEVLLLAPFWPLSRGIFQLAGATVREVPLWDRLAEIEDLEAWLEAAITEKTAAVYVNTPNNPTGAVLDHAGHAALARVACRHDLWVFFDEAYADLTATGAPAPQHHASIADRSLSFYTMSKSHGLAGARIGFVVGSDAAMPALRAAQTHAAYCAPRPMQVAAARALDGADGWVEEARGAYRRAARVAAEAFGQPIPEAGTFLFVDAAPFGGSSDALLEACADEGIIMAPGGVCGEAYAGFARLCFTAVDEATLGDAMMRIAPVLATLRG